MTAFGADIVVIGAGIVGASVAFELAGAGVDVVVLDRSAPNREGSGTTAGNFHIQALAPQRLGRPRDSARFIPLQRAAAAIWETLEAALDAPFEYRRCGGLVVAETDSELDVLRAKHALEQAGGIESYLLSADDARRELPLLGPTIIGADYCPSDGYVNPLKLVPALLTAAVRHGARVFSNCRVSALESASHGFRVDAGSRQWHAPVVVNAAGPWLDTVAAMLGVQVQLVPSAIQMSATVRTPPLLSHLVQHIARGLSLKQASAGNVLIGGGWPAADLNLDGRSPISVDSLVGNLQVAARVLPALASLRVLRAWAGPYCVTPDELPIIGQVPALPGMYIVGGPHAFTLGPLWGRVIRDLVLGAPAEVDLAGLGPTRTGHPQTPVAAEVRAHGR